MTLWTAQEVEQATGGKATGSFEATGVSIDTRTLKKGEIYIALKGEALDGHDYVDAAFKAGASAAIVRKGFGLDSLSRPAGEGRGEGAAPQDISDSSSGTTPSPSPLHGSPSSPAERERILVHVDDTMKALEDLGIASRARSKAKIIAVTGSAGKTGTKEMLSIVFGALGKTHASQKSFNNHWGVPLTLANMPKDTAYGVFELGMNHAGELLKLTAQVKPHIAIITTIEPVHIEFFKNAEAIADAKAEIFSSMGKLSGAGEAGGIAILNLDNPHFARLKAHAEKAGLKKIYSFGEDEEAQSRLIDCELHADSTKVTADILGERVKYKLNIPGKHITMNSLSALTAVKVAGGNLGVAVEALKNSEPVEGRGNRISVTIAEGQPPLTIINESYNANPASMMAAFEVFAMVEPAAGGRRLAVLGDMLELGRDGPMLHATLANPLLKAKADLLYCCGPMMDALYQTLPPDWRGAHTKESQELAKLVASVVRPGDVILVKGSKGSKMPYVIQALQSLALPQKAKETKHAV